jgi:hypothetical protein
MNSFDVYTPFLSNHSDLFTQEYEAQPRTVTDPRESTVLAIPATVMPDKSPIADSTTSATPSDGTAVTVSTTLSPPTTTLTPVSTTDTQRILDALAIQQAQLGALASFMTRNALMTTENQIFVVRDLIDKAREDLANIVDQYGADSNESAADSARVSSLAVKLASLEEDRDALINPSMLLK